MSGTRARSPRRLLSHCVPLLAIGSLLLSAGPRDAIAHVGPEPEPASPVAEAADAEQDEPGWSRSGGYFGIGGAFALERFDIEGQQHDSGSVLFRAGYRGLPWLAVELQGEVLPHFEGSGSAENDVSAFQVSVNGKLVLPLGRVEPWAMFGIGILDVDEDEGGRRDDFAFRYGVGADLHLTSRWSLYVEAAYLLPTGSVDRYDYATFGGGLLFRF